MLSKKDYLVDTFLEHHGIIGQKWGVRRYQNADGSMTALGKKRRKDFRTAEKDVVSKLSDEYFDFYKKPIDISEIESRGDISQKDAEMCIRLANKKFDEASKVEPKITKDVVSSVSDSGCRLYGLEYRLKQPTSMAGKIASDAKEKNISYEEAANRITDSIRYTSISSTDNFVSSYNSIKSSLEQKGYKEIKCKNYFDLYKKGKSMHKSVQSVYENQDGDTFELQFQTPSSQAAKELKLPLYEERRKSGINDTRAKELEVSMRELAEQVRNPKDIDSILSHSLNQEGEKDYLVDTFLEHHGIIGQKWGVRRYQNADGSLTALGAKRYGSSIDSGHDKMKAEIKSDAQKRSKKVQKQKAKTAKAIAKEKRRQRVLKEKEKTDALKKKAQEERELTKMVKQTDKNLKREEKRAKKEQKLIEKINRNKAEILKDPRKIMKNFDYLTDAEINKAMNRINLKKRVSDMTKEQLAIGADYLDTINRYTTSAFNFYNKFAAGYNAYNKFNNLSMKELPIIQIPGGGGGGKKRNKNRGKQNWQQNKGNANDDDDDDEE